MTTYTTIINQSGTISTITNTDYGVELILLILGIILIYALIMNLGRNISPWRRFIGSSLMVGIGALSMFIIPTEDMGITGFVIFGITILYFFMQISIIVRDINKNAEQM